MKGRQRANYTSNAGKRTHGWISGACVSPFSIPPQQPAPQQEVGPRGGCPPGRETESKVHPSCDILHPDRDPARTNLEAPEVSDRPNPSNFLSNQANHVPPFRTLTNESPRIQSSSSLASLLPSSRPETDRLTLAQSGKCPRHESNEP